MNAPNSEAPLGATCAFRSFGVRIKEVCGSYKYFVLTARISARLGGSLCLGGGIFAADRSPQRHKVSQRDTKRITSWDASEVLTSNTSSCLASWPPTLFQSSL